MSSRADTRQGFWDFLDRYPFTIGVTLTCLALFLYAGYRSGGWPVDPELRYLLGVNDSALLLREPWRLLTSAFLHYDFFHLAFNLVAIVYWGRIFEIHFGSARLWVLYVICTLVSALCSAGWQEAAVGLGVRDAGAASYGASGAVFGLLFLGMITAQRAPGRLGSLQTELRGWIGIGFLLAFLRSTAPIDHAAHLGGSLAGLALGWLCHPRPGEDLSPAWGGWALAAALAVLASFGRVMWGLRGAMV